MTHLTGQARRDAMQRCAAHVEEFGNRETYAQLAQRFGISKSSVHEALQVAGLTATHRVTRPVSLPELPEWMTK